MEIKNGIFQIPMWLFITVLLVALLIAAILTIFFIISYIKKRPFKAFGVELPEDKKNSSQIVNDINHTVNIHLMNESLDFTRIIDPKKKEELLDFYKNETLQDGAWELDAKDILIPGHPMEIKYAYSANLEITNKSMGYFEIIGSINLMHEISGEFIIKKNIKGIGYYVRNELSIIFRTYKEIITIGNSTTGLGTLYIRFNCVGNDFAKGYLIASNPSEFGIGIGTVQMKRKAQ